MQRAATRDPDVNYWLTGGAPQPLKDLATALLGSDEYFPPAGSAKPQKLRTA
ncbi:MAG: hypothetical protein WBN99_07525 [Mycobacterium sp.]